MHTLTIYINGEVSDICPMDYIDGKLRQLDGFYGLDAYGIDNGLTVPDTSEGAIDGDEINVFHDTASYDIYAAIDCGDISGVTSNGVTWNLD